MVRANQLGQAANAANQFAELKRVEQNRDDLDAVFRAETALKDDYIKFERDELGRLGENAKGAGERSQQWWGEAEKTYGQDLTQRQAFAFQRSATQLRQASAGTLGRHEQQQANKALEASSHARVGAAVNIAIADPTPERVENSRKEITEAVTLASNVVGDAPEVRDRKLQEAMTLMHRGVVMHLADSDSDRAKAYYYTNKKEIDGTTQITLEKTLETSGRVEKAQTVADEMMVKYPDVTQAIAYVENTYHGEDEKAIKAEVLNRFTTLKATKQAMSQTAYETGLLSVVQGRRVPAAVWSQMDDGHKAAIIERQRAEEKRRQAEAEGKAVKTDFGTWDKINRMVTEDPKGFVGFDLGRVSDRISRGDLQEFGNLQRRLRSGEDKPLKELVTLAQQIDVAVDGLKLNGQANDERRSQLRKSINDALITEQQGRKGTDPLTYDDRQKIIDRQIMQVTVPGFIWDSTKRSYELTPEERAKAKVVVPDADRKLIVEALKAKGRPTDEATIINLYKRQKGL